MMVEFLLGPEIALPGQFRVLCLQLANHDIAKPQLDL